MALLGALAMAGEPTRAAGGAPLSDRNDVIEVCAGCKFSKIETAVAAARPGGTIEVAAGIYPTNGVLIDKPLRLISTAGPEKTLLDGRGKGNVIYISADDVEVSGFTVANSGFSYVDDLAGIKIMDAARCRIAGNRVLDNFFGIYLGRTRDCVIESNQVRGAERTESAAGNGIHAWNVQRAVIRNNIVRNHRDGIYFEFVDGSSVTGNESSGNLRYGLHFMFSNADEYRLNVFKDNGSGVAVMYSRDIRMLNNKFENSRGAASYGLLLKEISASEVRANLFNRNTVGAFLEGTTRTLFIGNVFSENGWAMRILGNSDSNVVARNDFLANTFDLSTNATSNLNQITGNYWSTYDGIDLNRDGIGDTPYYPVRLSSFLIERNGILALLIRSLFFTALDQAEKVLPILTPDAYRDESPQMRRVAGK
jgi:nitrous oxidase accessory protein